MPTMRLEIVTAERVVFSDDVDLVVAPGIEGELGILPHHAPLLTILQPGEIRVVKAGQEQFLAVSGGFLEVLANKVTILADACEYAEEIDLERARRAMERAQQALATRQADVDLAQAMAALRRAQVRIAVARRRRAGGGPPPGAPLPGAGP
ncbi:ATP synthase epsilon chain [bacterium HR23]|nr:ATP synthase epsilon chain [bacterium HR23]